MLPAWWVFSQSLGGQGEKSRKDGQERRQVEKRGSGKQDEVINSRRVIGCVSSRLRALDKYPAACRALGGHRGLEHAVCVLVVLPADRVRHRLGRRVLLVDHACPIVGGGALRQE